MSALGTAWSYLVVSSDKQAETLDDQQSWANETASANGWVITRQFKSVSSGAHGTRELLDQLLAELRSTPASQRPERVLMIRLDRVGRGLALEPLAALAQIYKLGTLIHDRQDGDVRISRVSDTIKPILRILTGALENESRSDKARTGQAKRRANGQHAGHAPYGTVLDSAGKLVPSEPCASIVRRAFEMRATGAGYERIAHALGPTAPPKPLKDGGVRHIGWHRTFVRTMLLCHSYRGVVVDVDLFDRAQDVKNIDFKERAMQTFPWPLAGVLKCQCGYSYTGAASGGNCARCKDGRRKHTHQRIRYYRCNNPIAHQNMGGRRNVRADAIEAAFEALLHRLAAAPELVAAFANRTVDVDVGDLQSRLRDAEHSIDGLERRRAAAWDLQADGSLAKTELQLRLAALRAEQEQTERQIAELKRAIAMAAAEASLRPGAAKLFARAAETWRAAGVPDQKRMAQLVAAIVGGLRVSDAGRLLVGCDAESREKVEQMREINTLRDVQMAQRKADNQITKKFIESITE